MPAAAIPQSSAELYENNALFERLYGKDFFFVTGTVRGISPVAIAGEGFRLALDDVDFTLHRKIACNPNAADEGINEKQLAARKAFLDVRAADKYVARCFPTMREVRLQEAGGKGVCLLSAGVELFVHMDRGQGPEYHMALFTRTDRKLTGGNGLVSGPKAGETEALEEFTPVELNREGTRVHALVFDGTDRTERYETGFCAKTGQNDVLMKNLEAQKVFAGLPHYTVSVMEEMTPEAFGLNRTTNRLLNEDGNVLDTLRGVNGFEHYAHTLSTRRLALFTPEPGVRLLLIDGEPFNRKGAFYNETEAAAVLTQGNAIAGLLGLLEKICAHWPRPVAGKTLAPSLQLTM